MNKNLSKFANLKVGMTIAVGLIAFFVFVFVISSESTMFSKTYNLKVITKNAQGIKSGAMVTLAGLKIGKVESIQFIHPNGENLVEIDMLLRAEFQSQITPKSLALIKTVGLLGDKFIDISLGNDAVNALQNGAILPLEKQITIDNLSAEASPILNNLGVVITNLKNITSNLSNGNGTIGKLMSDSKTADDLSDAIANLNKFSEALINKNGTLGKLTFDDKLINKISKISDNLNMLIGSLQSGKGTLGKLINNDSLYNTLETTTINLNSTLKNINNDSNYFGGLIKNGKSAQHLDSLVQSLNNLITDFKSNPKKYIDVSVF